MVHQHMAQIHGYRAMCDMGHGTAFMEYRERIRRYKGLDLLPDRY